MTALYAPWDVPASVQDLLLGPPPAAYPGAPLFEFGAGDLAVDGSGNSTPADGYAAWVQWCIKALKVQRGAYPVYDLDYGVDWDGALQLGETERVQLYLAEEIPGALTLRGRDRRTRDVRALRLLSAGDSLQGEVTVVPESGAELSLSWTWPHG